MGYFDKFLMHEDKRDKGMNSTTNEKGTDGKKNNSSAYNHDYYMKNKEKWKDNDGSSKDNDTINELYEMSGMKKEKIKELLQLAKTKGFDSEEYKKLLDSLSEGDPEVYKKMEDVVKKNVDSSKSSSSGEQEFDVDAAAMDVIRGKYGNGAERKAALGEDYAQVQKRVNELMNAQKRVDELTNTQKSEKKKISKIGETPKLTNTKLNGLTASSLRSEKFAEKYARHMDVYNDQEYLIHHGILGQKWGVRRFQRPDGTRTPAGKRREQEGSDLSSKSADSNSSSGSKGISIDKKKLATGAAIAGAVALGAVLVTNPGARNVLTKYGTTAMTKLGGAAGKGAAKTVNFANKVVKKTGERLDRAADAMVDAALVSVGGIAIAKVTDKLAADENASEAEKNKSKVLTDAVTAGIKTATSAVGGSNNSSNGKKGDSLGKEITEKLGPPSNKGVDKQSKEYQELFKGQSEANRTLIKKLASNGYDVEQIRKHFDDWNDQFDHADFEDWASQYFAVEIGW